MNNFLFENSLDINYVELLAAFVLIFIIMVILPYMKKAKKEVAPSISRLFFSLIIFHICLGTGFIVGEHNMHQLTTKINEEYSVKFGKSKNLILFKTALKNKTQTRIRIQCDTLNYDECVQKVKNNLEKIISSKPDGPDQEIVVQF